MEDMEKKENETREFWKAFKELPVEEAMVFKQAIIGKAAYNKLEKFYGKPATAV